MSQENKKVYEKNLKKVLVETVLTSIGAGFSVSTITIFWNSIGMDQTAIGFVQMIFTIVLVCFDIPMGYIADRFNRKALNILGDMGVALAFVVYAFSQNMYMAILAESLLGIFTAMTNGVDQSFIKYNCNKIDPTGKKFKEINIRVHAFKYIASLIVVIIGGFISKYSLRLAIGISFIPFFIGGLIALKIEDFDEKIEVKHKNPLRDMASNVKEIVKHKKTRIYMFCYILGKEITHSQIWIFTPLLIMVGTPIEIVSFGWVAIQIMQLVGNRIAEKMIHIKISNKFAITMLTEIIWMLIIVINTNNFC